MKPYRFVFTMLLFFAANVHGQTPGYFQQDVHYDIDVLLLPTSGYLYGSYRLQYTNNSPDTLSCIYIHLYPNAYGSRDSELARELSSVIGGGKLIYYADERAHGFIDHLDFKSPQQKLERTDIAPDIARIDLQKPLIPGSSIEIRTPFRIKVPDAGYSRMGMNDMNFQITQWFPKPAVYDKQGWQTMSNRNIGEYYGEFGEFNVRLMVPEDFVTASTGTRVKEEPWNRKHLQDWDKLPDTENIPYKTLHIQAENVHTFAWCSGKDYKRLKESFTIAGTDKEVTANILYRNDKTHWQDYLSVIRESINFFSEKAGPYPYDQFTVVQSADQFGGGMEYPMLTIVDVAAGIDQEIVIMHEIGHNWFYGILGFNERAHPWMDEGLTSMYELVYMEQKFPNQNLLEILSSNAMTLNLFGLEKLEYKDKSRLAYQLLANKEQDKPSTLHTDEYSTTEYFIHAYNKAALQLYYFRSLVGEESFDAAMQRFFNNWKFKHPSPANFYHHLKEEFPEHGQWFVNEMLTTSKRANYAIRSVKEDGDSIHIKIKNKGDLSAPFHMTYEDREGKVKELTVDGFEDKQTITVKTDKNTRIHIDPENKLPETSRFFNQYDGTRLFSRYGRLRVKWLYHLPRERTKFLFHTPIAGYNVTDKFMAGWLFYNDPVFSYPLTFRLAPLYSTGSNELAGEGRINYAYSSRWKNFTGWKLKAYGKRYHYEQPEEKAPLAYHKLSTEL
ncbi:MAG: M1 family metallopeptidase, partial [Bacteroidales bacterium]